MKKRWILIGLIFLSIYLAPISLAVFENIKASLLGTTDYTDYWENRGKASGLDAIRKHEVESKPEYASIMLDPVERQRVEILYKYLRTPDPDSPPRAIGSGLGSMKRKILLDRWMDEPPVMYENNSINKQPDLSGVYYQRTIGGDGIGRWSIQYLNGPN